MAKISIPKKSTIRLVIKSTYWFLVGFVLAGVILASAILFYFQFTYRNRVIPGVFVNNIYIGEKNRSELQNIFKSKNQKIEKDTLTFTSDYGIATISAKTLGLGYDTNLITEQALGLGKTKNILSDVYLILSSYINGTFLNSPYTFNYDVLTKQLNPIEKSIYSQPVDAEFTVENNRVVAFKQSSDGKSLDYDALNTKIQDILPQLANGSMGTTKINIPIKIVKPELTTDKANNLGILEPIGVGRSTFYHSIPGRVHNVALATSKMNGVLVKPGEEFSFVKTIGDISAYTGYQQAYVISGGKTVLGDGGGVCQVSTTLFRAALNAGLPITERHAHAYRVGYYEQDAPPGMDATTYVPTVDFKFKNDTGKYIFIQALADTTNLTLTFTIYGTSDGRKVTVTQPVISNVASAPPDVYQDDPTLPVGTVKQVDFAAPGGKSVFTRTVTRNGKEIINDTFVSVYKPWQAVFLRGTKT